MRFPHIRLAPLPMVAVALATVAVAHATGLGGLFTGDVGSGTASVASCDNGFGTQYTTASGNATAVTINGIADPACEGGSLRVTLVNGSNASVASGGPTSVPTDGDTTDNSVTVSLSPQPAAGTVARIHVSIAGP